MADQLAGTRQQPLSLSEQLFSVPRPTRRAQASTALFGLLAFTSLAVPALSDVPSMHGTALITVGCMLMCGVAELVDRSLRTFCVALRFAGAGTAVFGFVLTLL